MEDNLLRVGIDTPEQLRSIGSEKTFVHIRTLVDPGACLHMLYGIQGAIDGVPDKLLSDDTKQRLRAFYNTL
ncbi:hypothetical protein D3C78_1916410 [compost metagenome]